MPQGREAMPTHSRPQLLSRLERCRQLWRVPVFSALTCALPAASCLMAAVPGSQPFDWWLLYPAHPSLPALPAPLKAVRGGCGLLPAQGNEWVLERVDRGFVEASTWLTPVQDSVRKACRG